MRRHWIAVIAALSSLPWVSAAEAQMGSSMLRSQTRIIERTVARNLDRVFKPKLVISKGATGPVTALALSQDEKLLITAIGNNTLRVWDLWVGREVARLSGHGARVTDIAISRDGKRAVSVAEDRTALVWDLKTFGAGTRVTEHAAAITGVGLSGNGARLFTASADGLLRVTALATGTREREWQAHDAGLVRLAASADGKRVVSAGADGKLKVWDAATGQVLADITVGSAILSVSLSRDDNTIAVAGADGQARLYGLDGSPLATIAGSVGGVLAVSMAAKTGTIVLGGTDGSVAVAERGTPGAVKVLGKHESRVSFVAVSADGAFALSGSEDGLTRLWNLKTGQPLLSLISTEGGWAVVDTKGRYDGTQAALDGIDWQGEDSTANIDDFAESHFQAALLPRILQSGEVAEAATITDGVRYPPSVRFLSPDAGSGGGGSRSVAVEVQAEDNGGGVAELRLYRNGKMVPAPPQIERRQENGAAIVTARYAVDLAPGGNVLTATAINEERLESRPQILTLSEGGRPIGALHLLTVGINRYAQSTLNLDYARPDAQAIAASLTGGQSAMRVAEAIAINDEQATKENILAALQRLRQVPAEDVVVVYMAGHGVSVGDAWFFVTHDVSNAEQVAALSRQGLSSAELKAEMEALNADRTLLMLDTCHSGTAVSPLKDYRGMKALRLLAKSVGTHILAATDRNQFAIELQKLGHGIFTYTVLAGLRGEADNSGDGRTSAAELIRFVEDNVPTLSRQYADYAQYPTGYSRGSDFTITRR